MSAENGTATGGESQARSLTTALRLLDLGFWPVPLSWPGRPLAKGKMSEGKDPLAGPGWGLQEPAGGTLRSIYARYPQAGLGARLGREGRLVDIEVDGEGGDEVLYRLFDGDTPGTVGWWARRGGHDGFLWHDDLLEFCASSGIIHIGPVELRLGGEGKQLQSAIPPSGWLDHEGVLHRRQWKGGNKFLELPEVFYINLRRLLKELKGPAEDRVGKAQDEATDSLSAKIIAYLAHIPPAVAGSGGSQVTFNAVHKLILRFPELTRDEVLDVMMRFYNPYCQPPWSFKEMAHKVDDAFRRRGPRPSQPTGMGFASDVIPDDQTEEDLGLITPSADTMQDIDWIEPGVLGAGGLTILAGEGGCGKSMIAYSFAARITIGGVFPCSETPTKGGRVLVLSSEERLRESMIPRLCAAGADLTCVKAVRAEERILDAHGERIRRPRSFQDIDWIQRILEKWPGVRLIIADNLASFLGPSVDENRNNDLRRVFDPFLKVLEDQVIALLGILHVGKNRESKTIRNAILGSVAYPNIARCVFMTFRDTEHDGRWLLCADKNNDGPTRQTMAYRIESAEVTRPHDRAIIKTSRVAWEETFDPTSIDDAFNRAHSRRRAAVKPQSKADVIQFMRQLISERQSVPSKTFMQLMEAAGFSRDHFYNYKNEAGLRSVKIGDEWWVKPDATQFAHSDTDPDTPPY